MSEGSPVGCTALARLEQHLQALGREAGTVAVAVSGGVDSMTLAVVAGRTLGEGARMYHALSPAVPPAATERVRTFAGREGWSLTTLDAGEFEDPEYRANPLERCYHCKRHLYRAVRSAVAGIVASGTNTDDLGDFRPGLAAAREQGVRHPWVEIGAPKSTVRAVARALGLPELAELPAAPCLSSRVETGIPIEAPVLAAIDRVERAVTSLLGARVARCRVRRDRIELELDPESLSRVTTPARRELEATVEAAFGAHQGERPVRLAPYRMGSAFVGAPPLPSPSSET